MADKYDDLDLGELFDLKPEVTKPSMGLSNVGQMAIGAGTDLVSGLLSGISAKKAAESQERMDELQNQINSQREDQRELDFESRKEMADKRFDQEKRLQSMREMQFNWAKDNRNFLKQIEKQMEKKKYIKENFSNLASQASMDDNFKQMLRRMGKL